MHFNLNAVLSRLSLYIIDISCMDITAPSSNKYDLEEENRGLLEREVKILGMIEPLTRILK